LASDVDVDIDDALIIRALNVPGGDVFEWRDDVAERIIAFARGASPVNDPLNAMHRGGAVGIYAASWSWSRVGSNRHRVRATVRNDADHAQLVEYGRGPSTGRETFSWTEWGGAIRTLRRGTRGWGGKHVLRNAANAVLPAASGGTVGPIS
jgi:Bacteriophage HK97-gp10, putative tail-component